MDTAAVPIPRHPLPSGNGLASGVGSSFSSVWLDSLIGARLASKQPSALLPEVQLYCSASQECSSRRAGQRAARPRHGGLEWDG